MAESISIPCSHIQDLIDEMVPIEVSLRLKELKLMLLQIQQGLEGEYTHFIDIQHFSYQIDDQLDTIYINIKLFERWAKSDMSNVLKALAIAYYKRRALHNIRSLIDLVRKGKYVRCQTSHTREHNELERSGPGFYNISHLVSNAYHEEISKVNSRHSRKHLNSIEGKNIIKIDKLLDYINMKRMYDNINFRKSFQAFALVSITKHSKTIHVYRDILKELLSNDKKNDVIGLLYMDEEKLCREVSEVLTSNKCLIVFTKDRSINFEDFGDPFKYPMESMLFVTPYWGDKITNRDGWKLFKSITFPDLQEDQIDAELKGIGKSIVGHCHGVPRQISRIGIVLRENYSKNVWEAKRSSISLFDGGFSHGKIVDSSYRQLPTDLKACCLYFGLFWKDEDISVETLYQMWMGEGLIIPYLLDKRETIMDIAEDNSAILASKLLIDVEESEFSASRKFVSCRVDHFVQEFCLRPDVFTPNEVTNVKETSYGFKSSSSDGCRLSLKFEFFAHQLHENGDIDTQLALTLREASNGLRSLLIQKANGVSTIQISFPSDISKKFKLLRVLKIQNFEIRGGNLPKDIRSLIHLRFLSLEGSTLEKLPKTLGNFRFMQTLDLRVAETIPRGIIVPNVLWKLKELRHLYLPACHQLPIGKEKLSLSGLNKLETIVNFDIQKVELTSLEWKNLRTIDARVHGKKTICDVIACINKSGDNLKETFLRASLSSSDYEESDIPFEDVFNCSKLNHFMVNWGRWDLIHEFKILSPFSSNVIELCLTRCQIREDPMPILGMFPTLKKLVLGKKTFMGRCMIFEEKSFPTLRYLKIQSLMHLERLEMQPNTLPNLFHLEIIYCIRLRMIPAGLIFIERLNELKLSMPIEFNDRIRRGEDVDKIQHVPYIFLEDW